MSKKVLFVMTSNAKLGNSSDRTGYHLAEVTHPYYVLKNAGYKIDFASPKGGEPPMDPGSHDLEDEDNKRFMEDEEAQAAMRQTFRTDAIRAQDYDAIYLPGGHGTMWDLPMDESLASLVAEIYENDGVVGSVCHGPAGLVNVKLSDGSYLVAGKEIAVFTDDEERAVEKDEVVPFLLASKLRERGAKHKAADNFKESVAVDGRLVTGQNPPSAKGVGEGIAKLLG